MAGILLFNVESEAELALLAARAEVLGIRARFALRVNPDVFADTHPYISTGLREHKFGIDIGLARGIYRKALELKWLDAVGVSVHIGSQIRAVEPFAAALARVAGLVGDLRKDGHDIRYVDAGGGLGIDYSDSPAEPKFDAARKVKDYAAALGKVSGLAETHLLVEPGRFLVAQAGALLTRVLVVKKNGTKTFVITDAAMNDLIRPALYQAHHEILPVAQAKGKARAGGRGGAGVRVGRLLCAGPRAAEGEAGRPGGAAGRGGVWDEPGVELQHAAAAGGGAGGRREGEVDPAARDVARTCSLRRLCRAEVRCPGYQPHVDRNCGFLGADIADTLA